MVRTLTGNFTTWTLFDTTRKYGTVQNLPYEQAIEAIMAVPYRGDTGKGQQRDIVEGHARDLRKEMRAGTFTPTPVAAALEPRHLKNLTLDDETFVLEVDSEDPLLHTDGGHRFVAIGNIIAELTERLESVKDEAEKADLERWLAQAKQLPVTVTVYFDGDPQKDFINLQKGRAVDASHLKSLAIAAGKEKNPALGVAFDIARLLHKDGQSPFHKSVKFDSRGSLPLPIATLTATGGSDIGTSLVGLARLGLAHGKDAAFLAEAVTTAYLTLKAASDKAEGDDGILEEGKVLTPVGNNGSKGASTMLTGVGLCLAYRLIALGKAQADAADLTKLVEAAEHSLNKTAKGNFSGPVKRALLGKFAKEFFADLADAPRHQGIPVPLLKALSCSTFAVNPLPKPKKEPKAKKPKAAKKEKAPKTSALPDVDGTPATVTTEPVTVTTEAVTIPAPTTEKVESVTVPAPWDAPAETPTAAAQGAAAWDQEIGA